MTDTKRSDWTRVALGDVVHHVRTRVDDPLEQGLDHYVPGGGISDDSFEISEWNRVDDGLMGPAFHLRFEPGQVLYKSRVPHGVAVPTRSGVCANTTYVLEPCSDRLLAELLPYLLTTSDFREFELVADKGSTNRYVNFSDVATYEFDLPPLDEQRRIVKVLGAAELARQRMQVVTVRLGVARISVIDALISCDSEGGSSVGDLCAMQNGRAFPGKEYCDDGVRLLRPGNLSPSGYLSWDPAVTRYLPSRFQEEAMDFLVKAGDVLINLTAQSLEDGFLGRSCIARKGDESLLNQRIGRFTDFSESLLPEFLFRVLQSSRFSQHAIGMCEGSKIKHLFWEHIARFQFRLPPTEEQLRIIDQLRCVDSAVDAAVGRLGEVVQLSGSLNSSTLDN